MTAYDLNLAETTIKLAKSEGFSPAAIVVPSAAGIPVSTGQTPEEYRAEVDELVALAREDETFAPSADELAAA